MKPEQPLLVSSTLVCNTRPEIVCSSASAVAMQLIFSSTSLLYTIYPSLPQVALRVRPMNRTEYNRGAVHAAQIVDSSVSAVWLSPEHSQHHHVLLCIEYAVTRYS